MTDYSIPFSSKMVRAIQRNTKSMTRRVASHKIVAYMESRPPFVHRFVTGLDPWHRDTFPDELKDHAPHQTESRSSVWYMEDCWKNLVGSMPLSELRCPYGVPGSLLWVKEAAYIALKDFPCGNQRDADGDLRAVAYYADGRNDAAENYGVYVRPAFLLPRWASRITLQITEIRLEKLQDISGIDAWNEGCINEHRDYEIALNDFVSLWDTINAKRSYPWSANPWVWAISFIKLEPVR